LSLALPVGKFTPYKIRSILGMTCAGYFANPPGFQRVYSGVRSDDTPLPMTKSPLGDFFGRNAPVTSSQIPLDFTPRLSM